MGNPLWLKRYGNPSDTRKEIIVADAGDGRMRRPR